MINFLLDLQWNDFYLSLEAEVEGVGQCARWRWSAGWRSAWWRTTFSSPQTTSVSLARLTSLQHLVISSSAGESVRSGNLRNKRPVMLVVRYHSLCHDNMTMTWQYQQSDWIYHSTGFNFNYPEAFFCVLNLSSSLDVQLPFGGPEDSSTPTSLSTLSSGTVCWWWYLEAADIKCLKVKIPVKLRCFWFSNVLLEIFQNKK